MTGMDVVVDFSPGFVSVTGTGEGFFSKRFVFPFGNSKEKEEFLALMREFVEDRVVVVFSRSFSVAEAFCLPSRDRGELSSMVTLLLARSTPHKKEDLLLDLRSVEDQDEKRSLVYAVMLTQETVREGLEAVEEAGVVPEAVTVSAEKLAALFQRLPMKTDVDRGYGLIFVSEDKVLMGFFFKGELLFSRESRSLAESGGQIDPFLMDCHRAFPEVDVSGVFVVGKDLVPRGVFPTFRQDIEIIGLADLVLSKEESDALAVSADAFLDVLLLQLRGDVLDLSPGEVVKAREREKRREVVRHFMVMAIMIVCGAVLLGMGWYFRSSAEMAARKAWIQERESAVVSVEEKMREIALMRRDLDRRVPFTLLLTELAHSLPEETVFRQVEIDNGFVNIRAEAGYVGAAQAFEEKLAMLPFLDDVVLKEVSQRIVEEGERMLFQVVGRIRS